MKAKKKPIVIDYLDYTGDNTAVVSWMESLNQNFYNIFLVSTDGELRVKTLEGTSYVVTTNDIIIKGQFNDYYPCKKDIFYATYDIITE
jgi:hypothetical protein